MGIRESLLNTITSVGNGDFIRIVTSAGASSKATLANVFKSFESGLGAKSNFGTSDYIRVVGSDNNSYKQSLNNVANTFEKSLAQKSSLTTSDFIRVVGSDNVSYKQSVPNVKSSLGLGVALESGTNLDTLTLPANDRCVRFYYGQSISTMTNIPSDLSSKDWPFCLELIPLGTGGTYTKQILHAYSTTSDVNNVYIRAQTYTSSGVVWTSWVKQPTRGEIDAINSNMVFESVQANISVNGSFSIDNNSPHSIFIVAYGTWNYSCLYAVFPNQGGTPISRLLSSYIGGTDDRISFSANGAWGITINNTSQYQMPVTVMKIKKG